MALYSFPERRSREIFSARIPEVTALGEALPPAWLGNSGAPAPLAPALDMERSRDMSSDFQPVIKWRWEASRMLASSGRPGGPGTTKGGELVVAEPLMELTSFVP